MNGSARFVATLLLVACSEGIASPRALLPAHTADRVDARAVELSEVPLPALSGGTLLITRDGSRAIVSSADSGRIHVVDINDAELVHSIELDALADPGRATEDDDGMVHVALRGEGAVLTIEPQRGELVRSTEVCRAPRGIAFDPGPRELLVACAEGVLVALPIDGGEPKRFELAPDLRDVVVADGTVSVTRMRSAEVLELDAARNVVASVKPAALEVFSNGGPETLKPNTAWRTIATPAGLLMLHQASSTATVDLDLTAEEELPYGGDPGDCNVMVAPTLTLVSGPQRPRMIAPLSGIVLAVDVAQSPDGKTIAIAVAGQSDETSPTQAEHLAVVEISTNDLETTDSCGPPRRRLPVEGQAVAVAYDQRGWLYVHTRAPSRLHMLPPDANGSIRVTLDDQTPGDTGHDIFHQDTGAGIACASCHPEGADDGRVWRFSDVGLRRTQALNAGLEGTAPFHWEGDFDEIDELLDEVHARRMGASEQSEERKQALTRWLFALPRPPAVRTTGDAIVRGEALFGELGCASCHLGSQLTNNQTVAIHGVSLQVPNLHGVALRPPYMHDGRAKDLAAAVLDMIEATAPGHTLAEAELSELVAYLESL